MSVVDVVGGITAWWVLLQWLVLSGQWHLLGQWLLVQPATAKALSCQDELTRDTTVSLHSCQQTLGKFCTGYRAQRECQPYKTLHL